MMLLKDIVDFLDGDIVMMMYAWSPNWNSNAVGNDHYNLYVRRSFDGGLTWTTTPAAEDELKYTCVDENGDAAMCDYTGLGIESAVENYYEYTRLVTPLTVEWTLWRR